MNGTMKATAAVLGGCLLLCPAARGRSETMPTQPLIVKARIKSGRPKPYKTRILKHLKDFAPKRPAQYSQYGGLLGRKYKATGFFHPRKIGDRWWLIDPEGCRFLHVAVNAVRPGRSPKNKRSLPVKFGTEAKWRAHTLALLREHGFNGTGCWSDDKLLASARRRLTYTPQWNFMSSYGARGGVRQLPGHMGYPNRCIFVFDPQFEAFADRHARQLAATKDNPYLLGHFSDNEMPFPRDSLDRYLTLDAKAPGHQAARAWLAGRKGRGEHRIAAKDRAEWLEHVADRYFRIVGRAIRKYDPNHLYLGSRFHGSDTRCEALFRAAGRRLDVVAVNVYGVWTPTRGMLRQWTRWSGRPVIVTEWYAKGDDAGLANTTGAGWTVAGQQERGWFYQNFTLGLLASRVCVGWHWFKYMDNDPEDTRTDPSNRDSNKGIVTTRYAPYKPLLDAMKALNDVVYPLTAYFDRGR